MLARIAPAVTRASASRFAPAAVRHYSAPTQSEQAAKAQHNKDDPETLAAKTAKDSQAHNRPDKLIDHPNDAPTQSEESAHAHKDSRSPDQLAQETSKRAQGSH
ncbi:hypothetical protein IE81DRAFT_324591 [Ceraceosorus guamensis]|uniref:Uncharacterized protein n=1 Tax=Ceraceosorus guamensis TaxID=1522189 RepID=A0A316VWK3_9BASI|nr:hypothetical protein IE81DRAFT_324591 [Ceraceosorus guamensis]PWN41328.1 hypothetical protein IE81DRAFT_324591 [Ceraceosorus guamensis]